MRNKMIYIFLCIASIAQAQDTLSKKDIPAAARLFDLNFTQKEIDSMYAGVKENVGVYQRMHKQSLANSVAPTLSHSAILPGMTFNEKQEKIDWNIPKNVNVPTDKNELAWYSIGQLASLLKNKKISSLELTQLFINRIKKYGDSLQCVISITESIAMEQAVKADAEIAAGKYRGPLHGIPYGLKDLFAVKGTKTTWGAEPYKDQVIDEDAYVYTKLKEAGAVLVAKFTLGALAMGD